MSVVKANHEIPLGGLLDRGVSPDSQAKDGRRALHIAVQCGHTRIMKKLLKAHADATIACESARTHLVFRQA